MRRPPRPARSRCRRTRRRTPTRAARRPRAVGPACSTRPSENTTTRSASVNASSWSWVTNTNVMPECRWISLSSICICSRSLRSSAPSGSSSRRTAGRSTSARASATRWRCPPDSAVGRRSASRLQAHGGQRRERALAAFGRGTFAIRSGYSTLLQHRQVREQRVVLEHGVDIAVEGRGRGDVPAAQQHRAGGGLLEARRSAAAPSSCRSPTGPAASRTRPRRCRGPARARRRRRPGTPCARPQRDRRLLTGLVRLRDRSRSSDWRHAHPPNGVVAG